MSGTSQPGIPFNPYKAWLGIEITGRKPTHYELLGLEFGFVDAEKAKVSVLERSAKVRHYQAGKHAELAAQVLDELAEAQLVLTDAKRKREYDLAVSALRQPAATENRKSKPEKNTAEQPKSNGDPQLAIKAHSVKMTLEKATGYQVKEIEPRASISLQFSGQNIGRSIKSKRHWYLYGFAISLAAVISIIIGGLAFWAVEKGRIDSIALDLSPICNPELETKQRPSINLTDSIQQTNLTHNSSPIINLKTVWLSDLNPNYWDAFFPFEKMKDQENARSFLQHPFEGPMPALAVYETKGAAAFSSKVRLDYDPSSPVRFAVRANGKILWQSNDLSQKGESDQCWIDIQNEKQIELLTRCKDSKTFAWAVWEEPHFINNNDYSAKIKETNKFLDIAAVHDYWKEGRNRIPKILNEPSISSARTTLQQMGEKRWLAEETPTKWDAFFPFEKMKDQGNARSFLQHPFEGPMPALAVYETKGATAFSSKVRLDYDPNSPVRFAVRANGKILWQSNDLSQKGESDQCWIDIQNEKQIELLTRCKDSKTFAWAVWEEPHFINNNDYTAKIKETTRFLDIPAFHDYWKEGQDRIPKISNEPSGESSAPISQKSITIRVFPENAKVALDARFGEIDVKGPERIVTLRKASDLQGAKIMVDADGFHAQEIDLPTNGTTVTPVILETKKYYLSDMSPPKSQFAEQPWRSLKEDQRQPNSFLLHPFKAPLVAFVRYETESMTAFSSKVRLDHDPGSPVRFAVRAMDKILWQSRDLNKKGDSEEFWLDVRGLSHIELLTRTQSSASAAWAIWEEPHFIKTDIYERKAKEMAKLLEISDIKDYWSVGVHDLTTGMPPKVASVSKNPVKPELKELYSMTRFIRGNWAGSNCALTSEIASYQTFGWKKDHFVCSVCKNQTAGMVLLVRKKQPNSQICYFELVSGPKINKSVATPLGWVWKEQASATNFKDDVIKVEVLQDAGGHWRLSSDLNEIEFLTQKGTWNTRFAFWAFKK